MAGGFQIAEVIEGKPERLWDKVKEYAAVTKEQFDAYFSGAAMGYGMMIANVWALDQTVPLEQLRERLPGFQSPQSYRYLKDTDIRMVGVSSEACFHEILL